VNKLVKDTIIELFYWLGSLPMTRKLMNPYRGQAAIITYHRVLPSNEINANNSPNKGLIVTTERFDQQMRYLSERYRIISMDELSNHLTSSSDFAVAVTFDDGYKDNLTYALPILKKYSVPATIYITTRLPEGDCQMWWYELEELCDSHTSIAFTAKGKDYNFNMRDRIQKKRCFRKILNLIQSLSENEEKALMDIIRQGRKPKHYRNYCLTWGEIQQLDGEPLITIGAHTHSHVNMKKNTIEELRKEILTSKLLLEEHLGHTIDHFAYPYGTSKEVGSRENTVVLECGFKTAVTSMCDSLKNNYQIYYSPRYAVFERDNSLKMDIKLSGWNAFWKYQL
jgi:peptidoglycan/xylan/chitin deacetylase (PgdA/CDA1 family)